MNVSRFSFLLHKPEKVTADHAREFQDVIDEYPYFQPARALQLKALKQDKSIQYNNSLKVVAAYTCDRSILFEFITSKEFIQNQVANRIMQSATGMAIEQLEVEDQEEVIVKDNKTAFNFNHVDSETVMDPELFQPKDPIHTSSDAKPEADEDEEEPKTPEATLKLGQPLDFDRSETHSFSEWLRLSGKLSPVDREPEEETASPATPPPSEDKQEEKQEQASGLKSKLDLIDKFIENNPKIAPVKKDGPSESLIKDEEAPRSALMTETLARVYLEQKKYKKAIQAYKILSLKYPEKSILFADQIEAIKKLRDSNK